MGLRCQPSAHGFLVIGVSLSLLIGLAWLASIIWFASYQTETYSIDDKGHTTKVDWQVSLLNHRLTISSKSYSGTLEACGLTETKFQELRAASSSRWIFRRQLEYVDRHRNYDKVHVEPWWRWPQIKPLSVMVHGPLQLAPGYTFIQRRYELRLWWPFFLCAVPTIVLRWWKRRPREGHCQECGYNLTGNLSGICPECGTPIPGRPEGQSLPS